MKYTKVYLEAIGYELAPIVVTSDELEERLEPLYRKLHLAAGSLEALTGIAERRWWEPRHSLSRSAAAAAKKALARSGITADALGTVVYAGVCRESFEPATACAVAAELGVEGAASVYDISNACLGILNGVYEVANRIAQMQLTAGGVRVVGAQTTLGSPGSGAGCFHTCVGL